MSKGKGKISHPSFGNLMSKIEEIFFFLISAAKEHLDEEEINQIIESPDHGGGTLFSTASYLSKKISRWILDRNVEVAFVDNMWLTPQFLFKSNYEKMLKKGINPFVVSFSGNTQFDFINPEKIDQKLLERFISGNLTEERTEAYYSFQDSECNEKCGDSCKDQMLKFKLYTGKKRFKKGKRGGEGCVTFGTWHRKPAAFKILELGKVERVDDADVSILNAERTRVEFETISKLSHPNILKVLHVFRHQKTKKRFENRSFENNTVIVMEKHDKNIGELTTEERIHMPDLLQDVLEYVQNQFILIFHFKQITCLRCVTTELTQNYATSRTFNRNFFLVLILNQHFHTEILPYLLIRPFSFYLAENHSQPLVPLN